MPRRRLEVDRDRVAVHYKPKNRWLRRFFRDGFAVALGIIVAAVLVMIAAHVSGVLPW